MLPPDAQQLNGFAEQGFVFLPSLFSDAEVAVLRAGAARIMARTGPEVVCEADSNTVRLVYGAHMYDEVFVRLGRHPHLVRAAEQLLETDGVYIHQSRLNPKAAFAGAEWEWHQDFATWHDRDGLKEPRALMVAVFIEDMTAANAPLLIVPGSSNNITPWPRTIFYLNLAASDNPPTIFKRAEHHCTRDWSPIEPLGEDCLLELIN